jgi:penicillin-binding protein 1A
MSSRKKPRQKSAAPSRRSSRGAKRGRGSRAWLWKLAGLLALLVAIVCVVYMVLASRFDIKQVEEIPERSTVYDCDGKYYSRLAGQNRVVIPYSGISNDFKHALLAREDTRFYEHAGVDPIGIARAIVRDVITMHARQGASTLTQQLARNTFELGGKTLHRKLLEAFVAARIEEHYTKQEILEHYVNRIYFGLSYYGVETASEAYFGKPLLKLNLAEAALLAGIIRGPNKFCPFTNPDGAIAQRNDVLQRMVDAGYINKTQQQAALNTPIHFAPRPPQTLQQNYAMGAVQDDLELILSDSQIEDGGLRIYTTIDPQLQKVAEDSVDNELRKVEKQPGYSHPTRAQFTKAMADAGQPTPYLQGSVVVMDNRTGAIRAVVGGRDYQESRYDRAFLSPRQIGSTFKPFVYAAAFARGLKPGSPIDDGPIRSGEIDGAPGWHPGNSDGTFHGPMPAANGLIFSRNTMSARVGNFATLEGVRKTASACGLTDIPKRPAIYLGAFESSLKNLTAAYTVFPNRGERRQPFLIERIDDSDGHTLYRASHLAASALDPGVCTTITSVLTQVLDHGTGATAKSLGLTRPAAGKTGTTNDYHDAWFVGYTGSLTCGVWVGLDKPQTIMPHGYGAALALPIWVDVIQSASLQRYPAPPMDGWHGQSNDYPAPKKRNFFDSIRHLFGAH